MREMFFDVYLRFSYFLSHPPLSSRSPDLHFIAHLTPHYSIPDVFLHMQSLVDGEHCEVELP